MILKTITNIKVGLQKYLFNLIFCKQFHSLYNMKEHNGDKIDMEKNYFFNI